MSWNKEDRNFKKGLNKRLTDSNGKYYFNEIGDLTQNIHIGEVWIDAIPVQPDGTFGSIEYYEDFELTEDTTVPGKRTWYAEDGGERLKGWVPDKYDNVDLSAYQVILKTGDGDVIPLGSSGYNWIFDYETGILTFETNPPGSYYSGGDLTLTGYRYVGRKGLDTSVIKTPCRVATTATTIDGDWAWTSTNSGTITITSTTSLVIDDIEINTIVNPSDTPTFNLVADRVFVKNYTGSDEYKNGIYVVTTEGSSSGTWILTRADDYNSSAKIYSDAVIFIQEGTDNTNTIWCMNNSSFTTLNATDNTGKITYGKGFGSFTGTGNYIPKFSSSGNSLEDSILEEVGGEYIYIHGAMLSPYKSFIIPHPIKEDYYLMYGCLEGPEHGIYHRGTSEGIGSVYVELPDYWSNICNEYSVSGLTEYGNYHVYIDEKNPKGFTVKAKGPFWNRFKKIKFDYYVVGERRRIVTEFPITNLGAHINMV